MGTKPLYESDQNMQSKLGKFQSNKNWNMNKLLLLSLKCIYGISQLGSLKKIITGKRFHEGKQLKLPSTKLIARSDLEITSYTQQYNNN